MTANVLSLPAEAYVYVIGADDGPRKIGVAINVDKRLGAIQSGSPVTLKCHHSRVVQRDIALTVEKSAHKILSAKRLSGEWFAVNTEEAATAIDMAVMEVERTIRNALPAISIYPGILTADQVRDGRKFLRWSMRELGEKVGISGSTVHRLESNLTEMKNFKFDTLQKIKSALEAGGIEFLDDGSVRRRKAE